MYIIITELSHRILYLLHVYSCLSRFDMSFGDPWAGMGQLIKMYVIHVIPGYIW